MRHYNDAEPRSERLPYVEALASQGRDEELVLYLASVDSGEIYARPFELGGDDQEELEIVISTRHALETKFDDGSLDPEDMHSFPKNMVNAVSLLDVMQVSGMELDEKKFRENYEGFIRGFALGVTPIIDTNLKIIGEELAASQWPDKEAPLPKFHTAQGLVAFIAERCGLTSDDLKFTDQNPDSPLSRASAWFPGIPHTALIYGDGTNESPFRPTEGATGIVRKIQSGEYSLDKLTTPYVPLQPAVRFTEGSQQSPNYHGGFGSNRTPLLRPEEVDTDNEHEVVGAIRVEEIDGNLVASIILEDGSTLPFTKAATRDLTIANPDISHLVGQQGVFRVEYVPGTDGQDILTVCEVYFEGE